MQKQVQIKYLLKTVKEFTGFHKQAQNVRVRANNEISLEGCCKSPDSALKSLTGPHQLYAD